MLENTVNTVVKKMYDVRRTICSTKKALQQFAVRLWFYTPIKPG